MADPGEADNNDLLPAYSLPYPLATLKTTDPLRRVRKLGGTLCKAAESAAHEVRMLCLVGSDD